MRKLILILALALPCFSQTDHFNNVKADGTLTITGLSTLSGGVASLTIPSYMRDCRTADGLISATTPAAATEQAANLQACINAAFTNSQSTVILPCGWIKVSTSIDATNRSNMHYLGCSSEEIPGTDPAANGAGQSNITTVMCNTGNICMDFTGSSQVSIKNILFRSSTTYSTPSKVALNWARDNALGGGTGMFCFSQFNVLENTFVFFDSVPAATAVGTIAIHNVAAEQFTIKGGKYISDTPLWTSASNLLGIVSAYQTIATGCPASMTAIKIGEGATFQTSTGSAWNLNSTFDLESDATTVLIGASGQAINMNNGTNSNLYIRGDIEGGFTAAINMNGGSDHNFFDMIVVSPPAGLISIAAGSVISDSRISLTQRNGATRDLFASIGAGVAIKGSQLILGNVTNGGAGVGNITLTESEVFAVGLTDTQTNNFNAASNFKMFTDTGISTVGADKFTGQVTSTLATGTPPFSIASTTAVPNLKVQNCDTCAITNGLRMTNTLLSNTAPTITAGGCGGAAASIATNNGTAAFSIGVGTTPTTACTVTLPTAANGWNCFGTDITTQSTSVFFQKQTATGATTATITNFNTAGTATNLVASDVMQVSCFAR